MADSDNSTTLPSVTRRRLMAGAAAASTMWPFGVAAQENTSRKVLREDPVLLVCERWQEVHDNTLALCRKQQLLETYLVRTIGFPDAKVRLAGGSEVTVRSIDDLPDIGLPEDEAVRGKAVAELAAHQARWDAIDDQIGYSRMDRLILQSEAAERALMNDLLLSPALTIGGMLAKLSVILCAAEHRGDPDDFPWPHIRSVQNDLTRLDGVDPAATPGS